MDAGSFFAIDHDRDVLYLNSLYRRTVLAGKPASVADAPLVKTLTFLLLQEEFSRERLTFGRRQWLAMCQNLLVEAVRAQAE